ncbi:class I SAM-dependent methyltransferase [Rhizobium arsenicireducens]
MGAFSHLTERLKLRKVKRKHGPDLRGLLWKRALEQSAEFVEDNLEDALIFADSEAIREYSFRQRPSEGLLLEFGVYRGASINGFARELARSQDHRRIHGFDAFLGLSEDWAGHGVEKHAHFSLGGHAPEVEGNVSLVTGWVEDTLPVFLAQNDGPIAFIHVDTDTYTPCKTILTLCADRLVPGSVILFDELLSYPGWRLGEYKALTECIDRQRYTWKAFAGHRAMLVVK